MHLSASYLNRHADKLMRKGALVVELVLGEFGGREISESCYCV